MAKVTETGFRLTAGKWAKSFITPRDLLPAGGKLLASAFLRPDGQVVTVTGAAILGATTINVGPIVNNVPNGTVLHFGADEFAVVNQVGGIPPNAAAQDVAVLALPTALEGGETAVYPGVKPKSLPSGTIVGRTYAERDAYTSFGPADLTTPDDEIFIVAYDIQDLDDDNNAELLLPNSHFVIAEDFLPGWAQMSAPQKAAIRSRWKTVKAVA